MVRSGPHQTNPHQVELRTFINKIISSILNVKEIGKTIKKVVYIPPIQVEAIFEGEAISPMGEMIIKPCNEKLMT